MKQIMQIILGRLALHKKSRYSELFWSAFVAHFLAFGLNTERCGVSLRIQSECGKMREIVNQHNSKYGHFLRSGESDSKDIHRKIVSSDKIITLSEMMNMDNWVVGTSNRLFIQSF